MNGEHMKLPFSSLLFMLIVLAVTPATVSADGKMFSAVGQLSSVTIPDQQALICFDGRVQTLVIDTRFVGEGTEFAWLVPVPSIPQIEAATEGLFPTLESLFVPRVMRRPFFDLTGLFIILLIGMAAGLVANTAREFVAVKVTCCLLALSLVVLVLLPSLGKAGALVPRDSVIIHGRSVVGVYDTVVLSGETPEAILSWLSENGFQAPEGIEAVVADYIAEGWVFAAAKITDSATTGTEYRRPHPLALRFETDQPVYPLRLTGVGNGDLSVDLYIFAEGSASIPGWTTAMSLSTVHPTNYVGSVIRVKQPIPVAHLGLKQFAGELPMATHLKATLSEQAMRSDARIEISPAKAYVPVLMTQSAASTQAINNTLLIAVVLVLGVSLLRFKLGMSRTRSLKWFAIAGAIAIIGYPVTLAAIPSVEEKELVGWRHQRQIFSSYTPVVKQLRIEAAELEPQEITLEWARERAAAIALDQSVRRKANPPLHQDSPNHYIIRQDADGSIFLTIYGDAGMIWDEDRIWP